jgi:hypothetical protein
MPHEAFPPHPATLVKLYANTRGGGWSEECPPIVGIKSGLPPAQRHEGSLSL